MNGNERESFLAGISLNRPVTVFMVLLSLLVVGVIAYVKIPILLQPEGRSRPFLMIRAGYPNSSPREVEKQITNPIEDMLETVNGIKETFSNSDTNGAFIFVKFDSNTDMDVAYGEVQNRLDRTRSQLPDDLEEIHISHRGPEDTPVMWFGVSMKVNPEDPHYFFKTHILQKIKRIDGVAKVDYGGIDSKEIQIKLNSEKIKAHRVSIYDLVRRLRDSNFTMTGGEVTSKGSIISIRSIGTFDSLEEIRNIPLGKGDLQLSDVATVSYEPPEKDRVYRVNGKKALNAAIYKESTANTVEVCRRLKNLFKEKLKNDPNLGGTDFHIFFNQGELIMGSINTLKKTGLYGGIFAFFILLFFLRRYLMTIIICLAIPLSVFIAITVMYFRGESLNVVSLMGLMLAVGMVVDNAIVLVEGIRQKREEGYSGKEAALRGASDVSLAITTATFTTLVVFLPLLLMFDNAVFRYMMKVFGFPICYALLASLFVALVFIPLISILIPRSGKTKQSRAINKAGIWLQKTVKWTLDHRVESLMIFLLLFSTTFLANDLLKKTDEMEGNIRNFQFRFIMPDNYTLEETGKIFEKIENIIFKHKEEYDIKDVLTRYRDTEGRVEVFLESADESDVKVKDAVKDFKELFPDFPGVKMLLGWHKSTGSGGDASVTLRLRGKDTKRLLELSETVARRLRTIPSVIDVETDRDRAKDEAVINVNRKLARKYGISPSVIAQTVAFSIRGTPLPEYRTSEREIDINLRFREKDRETVSQLKDLNVGSMGGRMIPLNTIADFSIQPGYGEIHHVNKKTTVEIKVDTTKEDMENLYNRIDEKMDEIVFPRGYSWSKGSRYSRMREASQTRQFAWVFSIVFVFLLMGVLFESFVLPLSILFSIPFAFFGAFWSLVITDTPMDMIVGIGMVLLIGIVVNNAIVLVDRINQFRRRGKSRREAILKGTKQRFRPIVMTALTTISGMVPMAIGSSNMVGIPFSPLGRAVIGGLIASTFSTLILLPLFYTFMEDFANLIRRFFFDPVRKWI